MRLVFICNEAPFPATHGGRVDVWRRLCAMHAAGAEIFLVFWCGDHEDEKPSSQALVRMGEVVECMKYFTIERSFTERLRRLLRLLRWPSHVASRVLTSSQRADLLEKILSFRPDAVWLESVYGGVLAEEISSALAIPLFCRSHNIEHLYMRRQVEKAISLRDRIAWNLNLFHLRKFELAILGKAQRYFDISADDLRWWKSQGLTNGEWLPPMVDNKFAEQLSAPRDQPPAFDVGYLGNLFSPNNVEGVLWFLDEVVSRLRAERPGLRVFIAGSRPVAKIVEAAKRHGVSLIANPEDVVPVLRDARVLVNPVFAGSGVNIKSVEMLFSPAQLVSSKQGIAGLSEEVARHFRCADFPDGFVAAVLDALDAPDNDLSVNRSKARAEFSFTRANDLIEDLQAVVKQYGKTGESV